MSGGVVGWDRMREKFWYVIVKMDGGTGRVWSASLILGIGFGIDRYCCLSNPRISYIR